MREDQSGHYYGVGMEVVGRNNSTIVVHPFVGSPAYKAGLLPNDVIASVSGKSAAELVQPKLPTCCAARAAPK